MKSYSIFLKSTITAVGLAALCTGQIFGQGIDRTRPVAREMRPIQLPQVETFKLNNGVEVYLISRPKLPIVNMMLSLPGGTAQNPADNKALSSTCMSFMTESTAELDKFAFAEAKADLAAQLYSYSAAEENEFSLQSLKKDFEPAFKLLSDVILTPGFRQEDLDFLIMQGIEGLKQSKTTPDALASSVGGAVINGINHPFVSLLKEEDYTKQTVEACQAYHAANIKPFGAKLFIAGDITSAEVISLFDKYLGTWTGRGPALASIPKPAPMKGKVFFVNLPDSVQSVLQVQAIGPNRLTPDYYALSMLFGVFGGDFASRVNMNLREDKGYSYGAFGYLNFTKEFGYYFAGSSVRADSTAQSIEELIKEINGLYAGTNAVTAEELGRVQNAAILGLPAYFENNYSALYSFKNLVFYGLPLNTYQESIPQISAVTLDQVNALAKAKLNLDDMKIMIVGDANALMIKRVTEVENGEEVAKDVPYMVGDKQLTLIEALKGLVKDPADLVILDADANPVAL